MPDGSSFPIFTITNGKKRVYAYRAAGGNRGDCPAAGAAAARAAVGKETGPNCSVPIEPASYQSGPGVL